MWDITEDVTSAWSGEPSVCSVFMHLDFVLVVGGGPEAFQVSRVISCLYFRKLKQARETRPCQEEP